MVLITTCISLQMLKLQWLFQNKIHVIHASFKLWFSKEDRKKQMQLEIFNINERWMIKYAVLERFEKTEVL